MKRPSAQIRSTQGRGVKTRLTSEPPDERLRARADEPGMTILGMVREGSLGGGALDLGRGGAMSVRRRFPVSLRGTGGSRKFVPLEVQAEWEKRQASQDQRPGLKSQTRPFFRQRSQS